MKRLALLLTLAFPSSALAQDSAAATNPGVGAARAMFQMQSAFVLRSAELMPEANYAFRPVSTVRTFGQLIGHVAGAQNMICAAVLGEPVKGEDDIETRMTTKAALVAAMKASSEYCARAYAQPDAALGAKIDLFGQQQTKLTALVLNAVHDAEHYGNLITYLRIKGMVPPSSAPAN